VPSCSSIRRTRPNRVTEGKEQPLLPVEPGYRHVLRARFATTWLVFCVLASVADQMLLSETRVHGALTIAAPIIGLLVVTIAPQRIYRRLRYRLTGQLLQVLKGWLFHTDTMVPLVRVQHLDVIRGPFDKMFGTATLIVHTAGTHNSVVSLPGLAPERAAEMRDIIREHVRTDFA
jgi:membrane protein YdbS with pleckstrin-like domain